MKLQITTILIIAALASCDDQTSKVTTSVQKSVVVDSRKQEKRDLYDFGYGFNNNNNNSPAGTDTFTGQLVSDHTIITNQIPVTVPHPVVYHLQVIKQVPIMYQANQIPAQVNQVAVPVVQAQQQQAYPLIVSRRYPVQLQGQYVLRPAPAAPQLGVPQRTGFVAPTYDVYGRSTNQGNQNLALTHALAYAN